MKRLSFTLVILAATVLAVYGAAWAQDDDDGVASMSFLVLRDYNGKPVRNASVVLHPVGKSGKQGRGGLELKADADGKCSYEGVPYGKVRVQVLAPGFQTFGQDYDVHKPTMEITVKLQRPQGQYSIYTDPQNDKKDNKDDKGGEPADPNAKPQK